MNALLLCVIALISYISGCFNTPVFACRFFYKRPLRSFGRGQEGFKKLFREESWLGILKIYLPDAVKIILTVLIGGWILGARGYAETGKIFALFCLEMGRMFPATHRFVGTLGIKELIIGMFIVNSIAGFMTLIVFAAAIALWRYMALAGVIAGFISILAVFVFVEAPSGVMIMAVVAVLIFFRNFNQLDRIRKHRAKKLTLKEDLSYKFDKSF